jgi:hypothetical protein
METLAANTGQAGAWVPEFVNTPPGHPRRATYKGELEDRPVFEGHSWSLRRAFQIHQQAPRLPDFTGYVSAIITEVPPGSPGEPPTLLLMMGVVLNEATAVRAEELLRTWMDPGISNDALPAAVEALGFD